MMLKKSKPKLAIIGAGGQCRAVLAILDLNGHQKPDYILDFGKSIKNEMIKDIPVLSLHTNEEIKKYGIDTSFILAIGDNEKRKEFYIKLHEYGYELCTVISKSAIISKNAKIGNGVVISQNVFVGPETEIGNNVILNTGSIIEHESHVGDHSHLAPGSVLCGRSKIGESAFLGAGAVVIDNVTIANNTTIGAGGVVIKSISEEGFTWVGIPAKSIKK